MPPQQTCFFFGFVGVVARRGLNLSIVQAKNAIDQALAARLKASAAALDDALSEKDAAGPPAASTRGVLALLRQFWGVLQARRRGPQLNLQDLSDRELADIGLTRGEIDYLTPQRAVERRRDSTAAFLWNRGGM